MHLLPLRPPVDGDECHLPESPLYDTHAHTNTHARPHARALYFHHACEHCSVAADECGRPISQEAAAGACHECVN